MPLSLSHEEQGHLLELATPIAKNRQPEFWSAVVTRLKSQNPAAVGIGSLIGRRNRPSPISEPAAGSQAGSAWATGFSELILFVFPQSPCRQCIAPPSLTHGAL